MGIISYAQNFEDVMLWRSLGNIPNGFYIDIGAQDPIVDSVSKAFYENGWCGINIEPTPNYANLLRQERPNDVVIQAAVSDKSGAMVFYEIPQTGISTGDPSIADEHKKRGFKVIEISVPCITLSQIFLRAGDREINWLKIDVEGFERRVLSSWGRSKVRPWVVVVESTLPLSQTESHKSWEHLLLKRGYQFVYFDGLNRFYVSEHHQELAGAFKSGPNVFDEFQLNGTASSSFCGKLNDKILNLGIEKNRVIASLESEWAREKDQINKLVIDVKREADKSVGLLLANINERERKVFNQSNYYVDRYKSQLIEAITSFSNKQQESLEYLKIGKQSDQNQLALVNESLVKLKAAIDSAENELKQASTDALRTSISEIHLLEQQQIERDRAHTVGLTGIAEQFKRFQLKAEENESNLKQALLHAEEVFLLNTCQIDKIKNQLDQRYAAELTQLTTEFNSFRLAAEKKELELQAVLQKVKEAEAHEILLIEQKFLAREQAHISEISSLNEKIRQSELQSREKEYKYLSISRSELNAAYGEISSLIHVIDGLKATHLIELNKAKDALRELKLEIHRVKLEQIVQLRNFRSDYEGLQKQRQEDNKKYIEFESQFRQESTKKIEQLNDELSVSEARIAECSIAINSLLDRSQKEKVELTRLFEEKCNSEVSLRQQISDISYELHHIQNSIFWKLTSYINIKRWLGSVNIGNNEVAKINLPAGQIITNSIGSDFKSDGSENGTKVIPIAIASEQSEYGHPSSLSVERKSDCCASSEIIEFVSTKLNACNELGGNSMVPEDFLRFDGEEFIHNVYCAVLHRNPDQAGLDHYISKYKSGTSKSHIVFQIASSKEAAALVDSNPIINQILNSSQFNKKPVWGLFGRDRNSAIINRLNIIENNLHRHSNVTTAAINKIIESNADLTRKVEVIFLNLVDFRQGYSHKHVINESKVDSTMSSISSQVPLPSGDGKSDDLRKSVFDNLASVHYHSNDESFLVSLEKAVTQSLEAKILANSKGMSDES